MVNDSFSRADGRAFNALRPVTFEPGFAPHAHGSVLVSFGNTRVICAATADTRVPPWMKEQGVAGGWVTAEYAMLPYSTNTRKPRDAAKGKLDGRSVEIQRMIGRALRAVVDLKKLPGVSLWVDCDVLQADGGTRTASITGGYVAAKLAVRQLLASGTITEDPFRASVAAVSVGIVNGHPCLDLPYVEDRDASADLNVVMTGDGDFVEVSGAGEEASFTRAQLDGLLDLAAGGIAEITAQQQAVIG